MDAHEIIVPNLAREIAVKLPQLSDANWNMALYRDGIHPKANGNAELALVIKMLT